MSRREFMQSSEYEAYGVRYVAQDMPARNGCSGCAHDSSQAGCEAAPSCGPHSRDDRRYVIWVKKEN